VGNVCVKRLFHLRVVARKIETCEFVEGPAIQGFDPKDVFIAHLNFLSYINLSKIFLPREI
jgi:hypothetical protein